ncbi:HAD-IB family phosphatase [Pontibacter vulgaris]|uniref:HAD-IB family phosphatase n=1 Tax=Pontibacter vulgaris TaxID=2905679 RepID=UPI001FA76E07|nr:HAD family hydrolase [Pontibacter vulgaris]
MASNDNEKEKIKVIVFDLNQTFYNKSSKDEFFKFICTKRPKRVRFFLEMMYYKLLHKMNQIRKTEFKENFFNYLDNLPPEKVEAYAAEFWQKEFPVNFNQELKSHFDKMKREGVQLFCATGGLEVYVKPLFKLYEIDGLAGTQTKYNGTTYLVEGKACKDEEKLKRLESHYKNQPFELIEAYSDSKEPILDEAEKAFLVKDGEIKPYK